MAGPTFNASTVTNNGSFSASSDHKTPALGALNLGGMTGLGALAGTTGTEASLVHGESWYQMEKNVTENILQTYKLTVTQDEIHKVLRNLQHNVNGTTNDTRVGVHNHTNIAPRNDEFIHTRSEIHHQPENRDQKTEDIDKTKERNEFYDKHFERNGFKLTFFYGPDINLNMVLTYEARMLAVGYKSIASEYVTLDCELKEIGTAINIVASQVVATVKAKLAPLHAKAVGANLNAGIAANGDSPLG